MAGRKEGQDGLSGEEEEKERRGEWMKGGGERRRGQEGYQYP